MATGKTLLAHLSSKFTAQTENIAVEALGHILSSSEGARNGLHDVLRSGGVGVGDISRVVTQSTGEEGERPDLTCYSGDDVRVLIEAKFWAGLTENQPVTYLKSLPVDKPSALLFVAPEARFVPLWAELRRRIEDEHAESITWEQSDSPSVVRTARTGGERMLVMTSWATLLNSMAVHVGDGAVRNDIQQLTGLAVREDEETLLPMRQEQLGSEFPRFMTHMSQLVDVVTTRAESCGWIDQSGLRATPQRHGYGRYIRLLPNSKRSDDDYSQWFGVHFELWRRFRDTPLWITYYYPNNWNEIREKLCARQSKQSDPIDFVDRERAIPIYLPMGVEYDAVLDGVVQQIRSLSDLLREEDDPA